METEKTITLELTEEEATTLQIPLLLHAEKTRKRLNEILNLNEEQKDPDELEDLKYERPLLINMIYKLNVALFPNKTTKV